MDAHALVATIVVVGTFFVPLAIAYMFFHRPSARKQLPEGRDPAFEERLDRIEVAVQAIALETERIAEGQRFTTKLLTDAPARAKAAGREGQ
ncbi:MAG: hypothetical protein ABI026_02630 [Gemmatimonadaceae bacterium]